MNNFGKLLGVAAVVGGGWWLWKQMSETKEAHVAPSQDQFVARNWGTIERVSTERNIFGWTSRWTDYELQWNGC